MISCFVNRKHHVTWKAMHMIMWKNYQTVSYETRRVSDEENLQAVKKTAGSMLIWSVCPWWTPAVRGRLFFLVTSILQLAASLRVPWHSGYFQGYIMHYIKGTCCLVIFFSCSSVCSHALSTSQWVVIIWLVSSSFCGISHWDNWH